LCSFIESYNAVEYTYRRSIEEDSEFDLRKHGAMERSLERAAQLIADARRVVIFSGAGVSTEAGVPAVSTQTQRM
jgi:hypothetical protein